MKQVNVKKAVLILGLISITGAMSSCDHRERVSTYEVTEAGDGWVENATVEKHKGPHGKVLTEKQSVFESAKCINPNGLQLMVDTPEACRKAGGKIVTEMVVKQEVISNKHHRHP